MLQKTRWTKSSAPGSSTAVNPYLFSRFFFQKFTFQNLSHGIQIHQYWDCLPLEKAHREKKKGSVNNQFHWDRVVLLVMVPALWQCQWATRLFGPAEEDLVLELHVQHCPELVASRLTQWPLTQANGPHKNPVLFHPRFQTKTSCLWTSHCVLNILMKFPP